jgi:hypothetical protein
MTPRVGETREQFLQRRRAADNVRYPKKIAYIPGHEQEIVQDLVKQLRGYEASTKELDKYIEELEAEIRRRDEEAREDQLRRSMKFTPLIIPVEEHLAGAPGMPMTLWSDWHWGETVDIRETGGLNEFNKAVAEQRVQNLVNRSITLLRDYSGLNPVFPGLWVLLGGDMVSGLIHDELVETNWGNIVTQAMEVAGAIAGAIRRLADEFGKIWVVGVVGNHGRTSSRPRAKGKARDSYDRAVYHSVASSLSGDDRFSFVIPDDTDYLFEVYGHRFLLTHGDALGVKGGDGIIGALGPIARGAVKLQTSEGNLGREFQTLILGHWHQYIPRGDALGCIVNGTLKGYDEYARVVLRARFARPSQALWIVSPKYGVAAQWPVYVD